MFLLACMKDNVKIPPSFFGKPLNTAIIEQLNEKYSNKVVYNVGLCVSVWDVVQIEDPIVHPGEGSSFVKATFRIAIFKPFIGEVLIGKVKYSDEDGIKVSVGFFEDIFVPAACLPLGSSFDASERVWIWNYEGNALYIDADEYIRIRVVSEKFVDVPPVEKELILSVNAAASNSSSTAANEISSVAAVAREYSKKTPPYIITASIAEDGLGLLAWWGNANEMQDQEQDQEA